MREGFQYFLVLTELHTRYKIVFLLKRKSDAEQCIFEAVARVERHFSKPLARVRVDNADVFLTQILLRCLRNKGIVIEPTIPNTPQENSISERTNRTIMERVRETIIAAQVPFEIYWGWCVIDTIVKTNSVI